MMKVTTADVIRALVSRGVFTLKEDAAYNIGIQDEQIVGIISTYVENTSYSNDLLQAHQDHLHIRGEH